MNIHIPENLRCEYEKNPLGVQRIRPLLSWQFPEKAASESGWQKAYQIVASSSEALLQEGIYDRWDSGVVESRRCYAVPYQGVEPKSGERIFWMVRIQDQSGVFSSFSKPAWFEMGLLEESDWKGNWMSFLGGLIGNGILMRYSFRCQPGKIVRARAYVCCVGYHELRINGRRIGDRLLDPAPTDYSKTVLYTAYDVTESLLPEDNVIGLILGTGWAGQPKVLVQLNIEYEDGSRQEEYTDWGIGWCVAKGPILYNSIYDGEDYDARLEKEGWDTPAYEPQFLKEHQRPGGWILATVVEDPGGRKTGALLPPIRIVRRSQPSCIGKLEDGSLLYDAGQNQTGWIRIQVSGAAGARVTLTFAEELTEQGTLNRTALRLARCQDNYILRGDKDVEEYAPRFTYHGFRYFTVQTQGDVKLHTLSVEFLHTDLHENARFHSDNPFFNRLSQVMKHTDACNLMGIPTDCSQRDERHGWTTDMTSRAEGCTYHYDMASFFEKWAGDIRDTQNKDGYFADTAPFRWGRRPCDPQVNTPVSLVLLLYRTYGNKRLMEESYEGLMRYVHALLKETEDLIISRTGFGEWACPREECYPEPYGAGAVSMHVTAALVSTAYLYLSISQLREMAQILGKKDVSYLTALMEDLRRKYNDRFFHPQTMQYDQGSQSANALSLDLGLASGKDVSGIVENILADIKSHNCHMTTGNMGTKALIEVLCRYGKEDTVYDLMMEKTSPSFGYMLDKGATTIWERWEADKDNDIMNSRNQPMLAAACVWFYKYLGGIQISMDQNGIQKLLIAPCVPDKMKQVQAGMDILNGPVSVSWTKEEAEFSLEVEIPFNTRAEVRIPEKCGILKEILRNGTQYPASFEHIDGIGTVLHLGSGAYHMVASKCAEKE